MNDQRTRLLVQRVEYHRANGFRSPEELLRFCEVFWGIKIPRQRVCPDHSCLAEYITAAWFEDSLNCVCWANRGGGKTMAGALVTWLESVFKAGCETKVLGGSGEQSLRMYNHIKKFNSEPFRHLARGEALKTYTELLNGSSIQILTASTKSVRGPHPQKLRLDEIDEKIYEAALLIPLSSGGIEASTHIYSTMHKSYGLMNQVIEGAAQSGYRIFKWCVLDVLEPCVDRDCANCGLWEDCGGKAKQASGFYRIDNAIDHKRQVSRETWLCEMLCFQPSQEGLIYKEFDMALHVI
jgi:hypothetical protein